VLHVISALAVVIELSAIDETVMFPVVKDISLLE